MLSGKSWPAPKSNGSSQQSARQLTDLRSIDDQMVEGRAAAAAYEFCAYGNEKTQGAVRLFRAKETGLPLRLEMGDPNAGGGMQMNYGELSAPVNIEVPACRPVILGLLRS